MDIVDLRTVKKRSALKKVNVDDFFLSKSSLELVLIDMLTMIRSIDDKFIMRKIFLSGLVEIPIFDMILLAYMSNNGALRHIWPMYVNFLG